MIIVIITILPWAAVALDGGSIIDLHPVQARTTKNSLNIQSVNGEGDCLSIGWPQLPSLQQSIQSQRKISRSIQYTIYVYRNIVPYLVIVVWIIIWVVGWVDITFWNNSVKFKGSHNTNQTLPAEGSANTAYLILSSQTKLPNCLQSSLRKYPSGADWWIQVEAEKNSIPWVEDPDSNNENIKWEKFRYLSPCSHS